MSYIIEDNIDFYTMLNDNTIVSNQIEPEMCLISNTKLDPNSSIKLMCGHSFNYLSIYKEVISQKIHASCLEVTKLKEYQMKCPYCRNIQNKLLPYIKMDNVEKMFGVNSPLHHTMCMNKCKYLFKSGKRKNFVCDSLCYAEFCNTHNKAVLAKTDNTNDYTKMTVAALREIAKTNQMKNLSKLKKAELLDMIMKNVKDLN